MLEKKSENNIIFCDSHFHYYDIISSYNDFNIPSNWKGCCCCLNEKEWNSIGDKSNFIMSFGIHPLHVIQTCALEQLYFLEDLLKENKINAVGEIGFDFFTHELSKNEQQQEEFFNYQMELAKKYAKPVVIHCRKANHKLFKYKNEFKKLPAVLFHSYMGSIVEANSLIADINCFFSFGKQIMNNNKKVIDCVKNLPLKNLLLETDAPFQHLRNEQYTKIEDIKNIYKSAFELREEKINYYDFTNILYENLIYLYYGKK